MEFEMSELFMGEESWQDFLPSISFYEDDLELQENVLDLCTDQTWMDLPSCCYNHEEATDTTRSMDLLADALAVAEAEDDLGIYLNDESSDSTLSSISGDDLLQQPDFNADALLNTSDHSSHQRDADTPESGVSFESEPEQDLVADALMQALCGEDLGVYMADDVSVSSSSVSAIDQTLFQRVINTHPEAVPEVPEAREQTSSKSSERPATMSSTTIDDHLANWLSQHMTATSSEKQHHSKPTNRPPESYLALIAKAILSQPSRRALLNDIYQFSLDNYEYYRTDPKTWKNAVRHNLSVNECFIKNGRAPYGRGYYWSVHPACVQSFLKGDFRRREARQLAVDMEKKKHSVPQVAYYVYMP